MRPLCVFDLDHTLVRSPLDLAKTKVEVRQLLADRGWPPPEGSERWTIGQTIAWASERAGDLGAACWTICETHERRALEAATCEAGALEALGALEAAGFPLAVWTNNGRVVTAQALDRCGLASFFGVVVTRDEAALKPDPAGLRLLARTYPERRVWVVGDSWVDGMAAQAGGAAFIAYGSDPAELARRGVSARTIVHDLRALPAWLLAEAG